MPPPLRLHALNDKTQPAPLAKAMLLVAALLLAFLGSFGWQTWRAIHAEETLQLQTVAELTERATDRYFSQMQLALGALADEIVAVDGLAQRARTQGLLSQFKSRHVELVGANLLGLDGHFLATSETTRLSGLPTAQNMRDFPAIVDSLAADAPLELSRPLVGPVVKRWILPMRYTVSGRDGRPVAFIVASLPVEMLQSFWSQAPVVANTSVALVRDDGYLISRFPVPAGTADAEVYGQPRTGAVMQQLSAQHRPLSGMVEGANLLSQEPYVSVFKRLEHFPVTLVAGMPVAELRLNWWRRVQVPYLIAALLALAWVVGMHRIGRLEAARKRERQLTEERLRESEALLNRTGQVAKVGGWSLELATGRLTWSEETRRIHEVDYSYQPSVDSALHFYAESFRPAIARAVQAGQATGTAWDLELPLITAQGRERWVRAQGEAESDEAGHPVRLVGTVQDITDYRQRRMELQQEQALRAQAEAHAGELERLLTERSEMLDVLAHEVRQPLNNASAAMQSATSTLVLPQDLGTRDSLRRASAVLNRVLSNIDNTLAVAALLADPQALRREDTDIDLLVRLCIDDMPEAQVHRLNIQRHTATRTAAMDLGLMRLALRNLMSNALRHSGNEGPITVRIADSDEPLALVIDVIDQGPGVDAALMPRLFERGARGRLADGERSHGLGLYIVKRVMELHGGSVQAINRPGHGLTMRLVIDQSA
jgi:signal transduction histidine kinase